jgi:hypothetical protein
VLDARSVCEFRGIGIEWQEWKVQMALFEEAEGSAKPKGDGHLQVEEDLGHAVVDDSRVHRVILHPRPGLEEVARFIATRGTPWLGRGGSTGLTVLPQTGTIDEGLEWRSKARTCLGNESQSSLGRILGLARGDREGAERVGRRRAVVDDVREPG